MRLRVVPAVLLAAVVSACSGVPRFPAPPAGAASLDRGVVVVTVVRDAAAEVGGPTGSVWAVTSGAPRVRDWTMEVDDDLGKAPEVVQEAVVLHELWHVLTGNVKPHSKVPGTVGRGMCSATAHPTEPVESDLAGILGRSFDVEAPAAPAWLRRALGRAIATWNRVLGREALRSRPS